MLARRPAEDAGSATGSNFEFQYHVAARHCCDLLGVDNPGWVLCEWHTDFAIGSGRQAEVLISVKHREPQRGHWTIARLCGEEGKLPTLRSRWEECGRPTECRFVTNASLDDAATALARACSESDQVGFAEIAKGGVAHRFSCSPEELIGFFEALRFECQLPGRHDIRAANVERHMLPALARLNLKAIDPWKAYDLVVDEVRAASQDRNGRHPAARRISSPGALDGGALIDATVQRRKIDRERLDAVLRPLAASESSATAIDKHDRRPWHTLAPATAVPRPHLSDRLVRMLTENLGSLNAVTAVHGTGGFGKTTLVQQVCQLESVKAAFSALLWTTFGEDVQGAALASRINDLAEQLTGRRPGWTDPQQAAMHLAAVVEEHGAPVLLVVDDVWRRSQLMPLTANAAKCTILVTTRNRGVLPAGTVTALIDRMSADEARAVLTRSVPDIPAPEIRDLLDATGRWPVLLAIVDSAMGQLVRYGMTPERAARHLLERIRVDGPTALDLNDVHSRDEAVAATVTAGLRLLPDGAIDRYAELAVFAEDSDIPLEAAALLWSRTAAMTRFQTDGLCAQLADLSLIGAFSFNTGTFRIHDVLRAVSQHRLGRKRVKALHAALLDSAQTFLDNRRDGEQVRPWWRLPPDQLYFVGNLARHLHGADLQQELRALVTDLRWTQRRIHDHGIAAALEDLAFVNDPTAAVLSRAIRQNAHLLVDVEPRTSLGAVLASRLDGVPELAAMVAQFSEDLARPLLTNCLPMPDHPAGTLRWTLPGQAGGSASLALSQAGDVLACEDAAGTMRLWDPGSGELLHTITGEPELGVIRFAPSGHHIIRICIKDRELSHFQVIDAAAGMLCHERRDIWNNSYDGPAVAFAPDGSYVAVAVPGADEGRIDIEAIDLCTGDSRILVEQVGPITAMAMSPDATLLVTGYASEETSGPCAVFVWDASTGDLLDELEGHVGGISEVLFVDATGLICTIDKEGSARLWNQDGELVRTLTGLGRLPNVALSPNGSLLSASGGDTHGVRIWDLNTGSLWLDLPADETWVSSQFSPDGSWLATCHVDLDTLGARTTVRIWDSATGDLRQQMEGLIDCSGSLAIAPDCSWIAGADGLSHEATPDDRVIRIWSVDSDSEASSPVETEQVQDYSISSDAQRVAYGPTAQGVAVTNASFSGTRFLRTNTATRMEFFADGDRLAICDGDSVRIWDLRTCTAGPPIAGGLGAIVDFTLAPDGSWMLTQHEGEDELRSRFESTMCVWDIATGYEVAPRARSLGSQGTALAPNGSWLAIADLSISRDKVSAVTLMKPPAGGTLGILDGHREGVGTLLAAPGGTWLLSTEARMNPLDPASVFLWDTSTHELQATLEGHSGAVRAADVTLNGKWFATGDRLGRLRVWDVDSAALVSAGDSDEALTALTFSPCGQWLAACSIVGGTGRLRIWDPRTCNPLASMSVDSPLYSCHWLTEPDTLCGIGDRGLYVFNWTC